MLRGLSLEVPQGAIVALLGANGAGKSTTLKAISGLLKTEDGEVTRGDIRFDGERIDGTDPDQIVRRGIFQVMEGRRIIADMTSLENLDSAPSPAPTARSTPTSSASSTISASEGAHRPRRLPLRRRAADARDRPRADGAADDPDGRAVHGIVAAAGEGGVRHIRPLNRELGITILLVEQNARMALQVASYGYIMEQGKVVLDGTAAELRDNEDVKEFYLGGDGDERKSFKNLKKLQSEGSRWLRRRRRRPGCSAEHRRLPRRRKDMIERRRRDRGDQRRHRAAIELVVPAARDGVPRVKPLEPRQCDARFIGGTGLARLGLRDPRLGHLGLRPQTSGVPPDVALASPSSTRQPVTSSR